MTFGKRLRQARTNKKMTQKQLADKIGAKHNSVSDWENDKNKPDPNTIQYICGALDISVDYLFPDVASNKVSFSLHEEDLIKKYRTLDGYGKEAVDTILNVEYRRCTTPTLPQSDEEEQNIIELDFPYQTASAGTGDFADDNSHEKLAVRLNENTRRADYLMRVNGDSMQPRFQDGDILLVHSQPSVENNEIGIFIVNGERLVKQQGIGQLISLNPDYENILINECDSVYCRGKVIGVLDTADIV